MTDLLDGLLAVLISLVLNAFILTRVRRNFPGEEGRFLTRLFVWTLLLRHVGAIFLNINAGSSQFALSFWGDSETYDYGGLYLSQSWGGESFFLARASAAPSGYGFHYFVGAIYYVFGRNQLLVQFLNATIGSFPVIVAYLIGKHLFDARAARWPALFMAFFPQMIFWSCAMYKDPSILLCIALAMYAVLRLRDKFTLFDLIIYVGACFALMTLRFYIFYVVAFATLGTFLFSQRRGIFGGLLVQLLLVVGVFGGIVLGVRGDMLTEQQSYFDIDKLQNARMGQAALGKSAYAADIDVTTSAGALSALPIGIAYLLLAPFPWAITGLRQLLTLPETLVWYALMPALVRGTLYTVRNRLRNALPILVFATTLTFAYAIFQTNVGTAYRQRTQVTMFFFILMGAGIEQKRQVSQQRKQGRETFHRPLPRPV